MSYLEDVLKQTQRTKARTASAKVGTSALIAQIQAKNALKQMAAAQPQVQAPRPAPRSAPAPTGGKGGPHHSNDGHNHGGGNQTVGEANELWRRLQKMIADRPTIKPGARSRSYAEQVRLWNLYKAGKGAMAARPGTSKHGTGRANDLKYGSEADRQWALANAKKYGLHFPLYNPKLGRGRDESWHVELLR